MFARVLRSLVLSLGLFALLVFTCFPSAGCGTAPVAAGANSPVTSGPVASAAVTVSALAVTTTIVGQGQAPPSTENVMAATGHSEAESYTASNLLHDKFFRALMQGDVEGVRACLVDDRKAEAETLCRDAAQWQKYGGQEAAWGGSTGIFAWTGQGFSGEPSPPVPAGLAAWMKEDPAQRLGLQVVMGDNVLWWFGADRQANGTWLVWPGERDPQYALSHTLAGLDTINIAAKPRQGVYVLLRLQQLPDSGSVWVDVTVKNGSQSTFTLRPTDISLEVDGALVPMTFVPHSPGILEVPAGQTDNPGNGWGWGFDKATSQTTRLTYTPSDAASDKTPWVGEAGL
jgi:hypothetical protein